MDGQRSTSCSPSNQLVISSSSRRSVIQELCLWGRAYEAARRSLRAVLLAARRALRGVRERASIAGDADGFGSHSNAFSEVGRVQAR